MRPWVYGVPLKRTTELTTMSERQRRTDADTANAVTRGIYILAVRNRSLARNYMEHKHVPQHVIRRVLDEPAARRAPSPEQAISEAIVPSSPDDTGGQPG